MPIDMTVVLKDEDGSPMPDFTRPDPAAAPPLTLGIAVARALHQSFERDESWEKKVARSLLAERIRNDPAAEMSAEEVAAAKAQMGKLYGGFLLMQAFPLLDPGMELPKVR